jgi:tetratricopeptide (TPR) repeat protein
MMNAFAKRVVILMVLVCAGISPLWAQDIADPGTSEPYHPALVSYRVGYYYQLRGDHERAIEEFTDVIAAFPNWDGGYSARGESYEALADYNLALADYSAALSLTPEFVSVLFMRGRAYHAIGEFGLAAADYANAIEQMPEYALPYRGMGDLLFEQENMAAALVMYQQYLALTSEDPDAQVITRVMQLETVAEADIL